MTAIGPAALLILLFAGAVASLAGVYAIEQAVRRALGMTQPR
ncbi:MAG: hypothetical protein AAB227_01445 [Pseudomonadota bacterium]